VGIKFNQAIQKFYIHTCKKVMKREMRKTIIITGVAICIICAALIFGAFFTQRDAIPARDLTLSDYPKVFANEVVCVVGENASQIESAEAIAVNFEYLTGKTEIISSEKIESFKCNQIFVILGTPKSDKVLEVVYQMTDAIRVTDEYPCAGKSVLEILSNHGNENKAMLLVEASNKHDTNTNFNIKVTDYSEFSIENAGNVTLTNITILRDKKEVIAQIPKLEVNESKNFSVKNMAGVSGIIPEEEELTAQNTGWLTVTCDQGIERKVVYWHIEAVPQKSQP
jgi:hypothetical protein